MGVSRILKDRNEEKEPCACGLTRRDVRNRNLQKDLERGISRGQENDRLESAHLNGTLAPKLDWTDVSPWL